MYLRDLKPCNRDNAILLKRSLNKIISGKTKVLLSEAEGQEYEGSLQDAQETPIINVVAY